MDDLPGKRKKNKAKQSPSDAGLSRRDFLKISGASAAAPLIARATVLSAQEAQLPHQGPGKVAVTLTVNGKRLAAQLEPRVTLLDALRDHFDLTGAKRVCDRGTCGSCTVIMDGKTVYSCSILAIDAQSKPITTVEGISQNGRLHPVQQAFIDNDAQQCGFCTPGFIVASKALLDTHPSPSLEQVKHGLSGNFCRCGTYVGMRAALQTAKSGKEA